MIRTRAFCLKHVLLGCLFSAAFTGVAAAQTPGVIVDGAYVYAGPGPEYPVVASMPPGAQVLTFGCLQDWGWCDVGSGPYRGWVPGGAIELMYQNQYGPLSAFGPMMGLPLVGFAFDDYWGAHYRGQPWFAERDRWGGGFGRGPGGGGPGGGPGGGVGGGWGGRQGGGPGGGWGQGGGQERPGGRGDMGGFQGGGNPAARMEAGRPEGGWGQGGGGPGGGGQPHGGERGGPGGGQPGGGEHGGGGRGQDHGPH